MSDWSHGYDVSTSYSYGFYREMAPDWLDLCAWIGGLDPPARSGNRFRYLDLGCGQGFGLCLLAAANPQAEFVGIDFQPEHIDHAQGLAQSAGLPNVRFVQADFLDLAADWPRDLATFDYVALHGILSWVVPALREAVVQCVAHATARGGLVYVSYNAQPGCLSSIPLQHFSSRLNEFSGRGDATGVEDAIALLDRLASANAPVFQVLPALKPRVDALKTRDRNYLVHEYLTQGWTPFWHSDVVRHFRRADLDYAASATLADNLILEFLPAAQREAVIEQPAELRQDLQDFIINKAFRRDIFCRGAKPSGDQAAKEALIVHLAASPGPGRTLNFETSFGQIAWDPAVFTPIVEALRDAPRTLDELSRLPNATKWRPRHILLLLLHANVLAPEVAEPGDAAPAHRLNAVIARAACDGAPYEYLAANRLGSAIRASREELLLLDAWFELKSAQDARSLGAALGHRLSRLGLEAANSDEQDAAAAKFLADTLPRYRQLGVLD